MNKSLCFTGCRPHKLNMPYDISDKAYCNLINVITDKIIHYIKQGVNIFYTGGADGIDILCFFIIHKLKKTYPNLKNIVCIPTSKQREWTKSGKWYDIMLKCADDLILVYELSNYKTDNIYDKLQNRNKYMVDHSDYVFGVWNGLSGGTYNCIKYAKSKNKNIECIITEDIMQIIKNDATQYIKEEVPKLLLTCLEETDKSKREDSFKNLMSLINKEIIKHGEYKVVFEESNQLDDILIKSEIESISSNQVIFKYNDDYNITIDFK